MNSSDIRSRFLAFFDKKSHTIIPSASLVTPDEKGITNSTLFNTAGMQPLVPYLLGKTFVRDGKESKRVADVQKCLRTIDIDSIGDKTHATFFEMLGNWSFGDYFKTEAINWSYEFLTSKSEGLGLDPSKLYVTVFEGDEVAPRDDEAVAIWKEVFSKNGIAGAHSDTSKGEAGRIFYMPAENNWWQAGENGPCGPDTEMFYDVGNRFGGRPITKAEYVDADDKRDVVEIWNDVFMQFEKKDGKIIGKLPKPSVDTGAGLERLTMTLQGVDNIYDTDLLKPAMDKLKELSKSFDITSARIVADHIKSSVMLINDGVIPSNTDRGYVLRKLIRRVVRHADKLGLSEGQLESVAATLIEVYRNIYKEVNSNKDQIISEILREETKFRQTLKNGLNVLNNKILSHQIDIDKFGSHSRREIISGSDAFNLFQSYGFPIELTIEIAKENNTDVDIDGFNKEFKAHQDLSRTGAEQKFKGGLADANDPMVVRYHTATHLLHQALHDVLGDDVGQKGSNITPERLRFDFSYNAKMTDEQKKKVEDIVNEKISAKLPVNKVVMPFAEAEKTGARHFFGEKYGDEISIYLVGDTIADSYSKEFCGGPHVMNTSDLAGPEGKWKFKIQKEEAIAQGVRRIKAVLM